jgi:hypothetical protein
MSRSAKMLLQVRSHFARGKKLLPGAIEHNRKETENRAIDKPLLTQPIANRKMNKFSSFWLRSRKELHHQTAPALVKACDLIAVEQLNIKKLAQTKPAKSILDAPQPAFLAIFSAKDSVA